MGLAVPEREAWVLAGFVPVSPIESSRIDLERKRLGFDPTRNSIRLTALTVDSAERSPKRVLNSLTNGVKLNYNAKAIYVSDSFAFRNPTLTFAANDKISDFELNWDNLKSPKNAGVVSGMAQFDNSKATILFDKIKGTANVKPM